MYLEALHQFLTHIQTNLKRRKGIEKWLTEPHWQALHNFYAQLDFASVVCQPTEKTRFVVIDTETTGWHAYSGDEIVSISMLEMQGLHLTGREYQTLINPDRPIPPETTAIHGIKDEDVKDSPKISEVIPEVIKFIGDSVIVGHHINFDLRFFNKTMQKIMLCKFLNPWIDTMLLYTAYSGRMGHYSLDEIASICKVENPARHTAWGDALATAKIFQRIAAHMFKPNMVVSDLIKIQHEVGHF